MHAWWEWLVMVVGGVVAMVTLAWVWVLGFLGLVAALGRRRHGH